MSAPPEPGLPEAEAVKAGSVLSAGSSSPRSCPHTMDSLPATVPAVTASPGDPELLGPLSVLYAALIAKLLEVTVPSRREGSRLWQAGGPVVGRASVQSDGPGEASGARSPGPAGRGAAVWDALVACWVFREHCHSDRQCVTWWSPFLAAVSGVGPIL